MRSDPCAPDRAVLVEGLGKRYRLGEREPYRTVRASIAGLPARLGRGDGAARTRGELWALRDVDLEVGHGEVLGVVGHNGAGKSTLLKILSRVTSPTEGHARLRGRVSALLEVGTGFHPELTGRENVVLNGSVLGMSRAEIAARFDAIVDFAEIGGFIDTPIKRYSSGMQVRLAFAVAAFLEPEILIVDEVLAVGDAAFQRKCLGKLGSSSRAGRTVLFVSHNLPAVRTLCTRAILLDHGRLVLDDTPDAVIAAYLSARTGAGDRWDLTESRRPGYELGARLRFTFLEIEGVSEAGTVPVGGDLVVRIRFEVQAPVRDLLLRLNVSTVEDVLIAQSVTSNVYAPLAYVEPGTYEIEAGIAGAPLQPGRYQIGVGARSGTMAEDQVDGAGLVEFVESVPLESPWFGGPGGYLRLPVDWTKPVPVI
jgi:lipopolysaccharide transport system ATP-binding protein